jgi:hypothetical protein
MPENIGLPQTAINLKNLRNSFQQLAKVWVINYPLDDFFARRICELMADRVLQYRTLSFYSGLPDRT